MPATVSATSAGIVPKTSGSGLLDVAPPVPRRSALSGDKAHTYTYSNA